MKELHSKGLANHAGPESCEEVSNDLLEALTGERAGWVLSREITFRGADDVGEYGRQQRTSRNGKTRTYPARSETPCMYGNNLRENRDILCSTPTGRVEGRIGKSKDTRR